MRRLVGSVRCFVEEELCCIGTGAMRSRRRIALRAHATIAALLSAIQLAARAHVIQASLARTVTAARLFLFAFAFSLLVKQDNKWGLNTKCQGCVDCNCGLASISLQCNQTTGQCPCQEGAGGSYCDHCLDGYYNFTDNGCISEWLYFVKCRQVLIAQSATAMTIYR